VFENQNLQLKKDLQQPGQPQGMPELEVEIGICLEFLIFPVLCSYINKIPVTLKAAGSEYGAFTHFNSTFYKLASEAVICNILFLYLVSNSFRFCALQLGIHRLHCDTAV